MGTKLKFKDETVKLIKKAKEASFKNLGHAGAAIRMTARRSIKKSKGKSQEGTPPNTRKGRLKNAIMYAVEKDKQTVVVGPDAEIAGTSGKAHEFGGRYRKENYPKRPFMAPALEKLKKRIPTMWANSVKS